MQLQGKYVGGHTQAVAHPPFAEMATLNQLVTTRFVSSCCCDGESSLLLYGSLETMHTTEKGRSNISSLCGRRKRLGSAERNSVFAKLTK